MNDTFVLIAKQIKKQFVLPENIILNILNGIDLSITAKQSLAIVGHSGSGKSTLLSILTGLDRPTEGSVILAGNDITAMNEQQLTRFRAQHIGIVFQNFHLMPHLTALENVCLPLEILRRKKAERQTIETLAQQALDLVQLSHRGKHFPYQLSGGELQRVAIARAFVTKPDILLADEPTGNLDQQTGRDISDLLFQLIEQEGMTMVLVTHNLELANRCGRTLSMQGGRLQ